MLILWMLGCYSSTAVRQQKRRDRRKRFSIFGLLDRPSPHIADVLPLSMSTPQRCMILDSPRSTIKRLVDEQDKSIRYCRRSRSNGVTWSYIRRLQTSLAAEFRTDCSLSSRHFGVLASRLLQRST